MRSVAASASYNRLVPLPERTVEDIVREIQDGRNAEANYQTLYLRFSSQVCRFFQRRGLPDEDCLDSTQEVFLLAFRGLKELRDPPLFHSWLFAIARNVFNNTLSRQYATKRSALQVVKPRDPEEDPLASIPAPGSREGALKTVLDKEKLDGVIAALKELPQQMRRCLILRLAHECSYEEVAAVMGLSINTVKVHLHKGRKELKDRLGPVFGDLEV